MRLTAQNKRRGFLRPPLVRASIEGTPISANHAMSTGDQYPPPKHEFPLRRVVGGDAMRDAQADVPSAKRLRAQLAFKNSMVHGILQFTPSIAFCYVLHRCVSRDIRCRESFIIKKKPHSMSAPRTGQHETSLLKFSFPWHTLCRGLLFRQ